jgi:hypothetical protein
MADNQNKASLRQILRSGLASKKGGDHVADKIKELQTKLNALLAKLDADAGVTDVNYASTLGVTVTDVDSRG